jgi:hypothetical protein
MDKTLLNESKIFEKQELKWFTPKMMKKNIREFRNFYQEIVSLLLKELSKIRQFIEKKKSKNKKTRSNKKTMKLMKGG